MTKKLKKTINFANLEVFMKSKVYFTKDLTSEGLIKIYNALGVKLKGKVAVKISTGEPGGHHFLNPKLI